MTALTPRHDSPNSGLFVAAAMERELSLIKKKLDGSAGVTFHTVGIGRERAYQGIRSLLKPDADPAIDRPPAVLLLGFAGAVEPSLKPGDLILSSRYYRSGSTPEASSRDIPHLPDFLEPDTLMRQQAVESVHETALRFSPSPSLTVDHLIDSPEAKRAIFERYPVATVNMEDYSAAAAALEAGVPFLSVKAVLDVADQRLPGYLPSLSLPGPRAGLSALAHPWRLATLLRLAVQMKRAQWALAQFALSFIPKMADLPHAAAMASAPEIGNSNRLLHRHPLQCVQSSPSSITGLATGLNK